MFNTYICLRWFVFAFRGIQTAPCSIFTKTLVCLVIKLLKEGCLLLTALCESEFYFPWCPLLD